MFGLLRRPVTALVSRSSNVVRTHGHGHGPIRPGDDLPFDINNRYKLTLTFVLFMSSAMAIPFLGVRHQMLKA